MMGIKGREKRDKKKANGISINGIMIERKNEGMRFNRSEMIKKGNRSGTVSGIITEHAGSESWGSESGDADEKEDPMMIVDKSITSSVFTTRII